jgi:hypothetical protein
MITETGHSTGAVISPKDERDYKYGILGSASIPFDWEKGFDIEDKVGKIPVKDQAQSSSCGGQAWANYSYALDETDREEKSAKYIYCQTHVGVGGSTGRDNCNICKNQGVSKETLCPSYPATEQFLTTDDRTPQAIADAKTNKEKYYARIDLNIEEVAKAIRDNNGCVLGISGQNNGTWLSKFPLPPVNNNVWNHWVYCGKAKIINGKKYIGFINSWGTNIGENGWQFVSEDYFNSPFGFFEGWIMTYDPQIIPPVSMPTLRKGSRGEAVKTLQKLLGGLVIDGIFGNNTEKAVKKYQKIQGLNNDGIVGKLTWGRLNA